MLTKCVNPKCKAEFHRLGEGRLFEVNFDEPELRRKAGVSSSMHVLRKETRSTERFWLCASCAESLTLVINERTNRVLLAPLAEHKPEPCCSAEMDESLESPMSAPMPPQAMLGGAERLAVS